MPRYLVKLYGTVTRDVKSELVHSPDAEQASLTAAASHPFYRPGVVIQAKDDCEVCRGHGIERLSTHDVICPKCFQD